MPETMLDIETLRAALGWATLIHLALLIFWVLVFILAHDWMYRMHRCWFNLSLEKFDAIHYAGIAFYKISIILLSLVPYLALHIIS